MVEQELGPYRILKKIGAGGMGEVYRARDTRLERDVAIKLLPAEHFADPLARGRLEREARSAAKLNHPHICTVFDVGEADGNVYVAMELVEGEPLSDRLSGGALPTDQLVRFALQLADALDHAHRRGIVHRDFKCANVVIASDGRAKVLDFGLAKRMQGTDPGGADDSAFTVTQPGMVMGTLAYMAPEQLRGESVDARADIWALGVVMYEMAVGHRPFDGGTAYEVSNKILSEPPKPLAATVPTLIRNVIERCLIKEREQRYQSAGEVRASIESLPTEAAPVWAPVLDAARARPWRSAAMAVAVAAALSFGLDAGGLRERVLGRFGGPAIESLVVLPLSNLSGDPEEEYLADGMTEALIGELSKLEGLSVVSRTSAMQYKEANKPLPEIVAELGVDGVIEGGVFREGNLVRASINLIDGATDTTLWAQSFERESEGILALHSDMARAIADGVQLTLSPQEEALLASARPIDPEAYEAYLKGRMHWYRQTPQDVDRALQYFQFAEEKDPGFALAYLGMGYVWTYYASVGLLPPGEMREKVVEVLQKAREIDPTLAETYESEADFQFYYDWDWYGAERSYKRAIEMKPNSADMRLYYWEFLSAMKRPTEAQTQIERCLELDPFNAYVQMAYGMFLLSTRRFDDAIDQFRSVLDTEMDFGPAELGLWQAYHHTGRYDQAVGSITEYFSKWDDDEMAEVVREAYEEAGYEEAMRRAGEKLVERSETFYVLGTQVASFFAYAGENDRAVEWLQNAFTERETGLVKLQVDPDWDTLRDDPRFQAIVRQMDFPPS